MCCLAAVCGWMGFYVFFPFRLLQIPFVTSVQVLCHFSPPIRTLNFVLKKIKTQLKSYQEPANQFALLTLLVLIMICPTSAPLVQRQISINNPLYFSDSFSSVHHSVIEETNVTKAGSVIYFSVQRRQRINGDTLTFQ